MTLQIARNVMLPSEVLDPLRDVARLLLTPLGIDCRLRRRRHGTRPSYLVATITSKGADLLTASSSRLAGSAVDEATQVRDLADRINDHIRCNMGVSMATRHGVRIGLDLPGRPASEHHVLASACEGLAAVGVSSVAVQLAWPGALPQSYSAVVEFGDERVILDTIVEACAGYGLDRQVLLLATRLDALRIELVP